MNEHRHRPPAAALAGAVTSYLWYREQGARPRVHRGLPSGSLSIIVSIGPTIDVLASADGTEPVRRHRAVLNGLHTSPAFIQHGHCQEGVVIDLDPVGVGSLLGVPASALWDTSVELDDALGSVGAELWERLQDSDGVEQGFAVCDDVLSRVARSTPSRTPDAEIAEAWRMIAGSHGAAPVGDIARGVGWSRQHLARRFRSELGLSPKQAGRLVRFGRSRDRLRAAAGRVPLSQVAVECGYYDQAHLTNEWNDLAGCPPAAWCRAEGVPFVQDGIDRLEARS